MKTFTSKTIAAALAGAMAVTCASCSMLPGDGAKTEDIVDAADSFAKALASCDAGKIAKQTNEGKDVAEDLEELFGSEDYTEEQNKIADAIADTIEYEIDEDSVEIKKDEASVDVTFTMVDYESVLDGEFKNVDEAVDALKDCDDTCEVEITFEFEKDEDDWLVSNFGDKKYTELYWFYGLDVSFAPDLVIEDSSIIGEYNYIYTVVTFTEDISDYADGFTFDVYLDGELYYGNMTPEIDEQYLFCDLTLDGPLDSGNYTITVCYNDEEIVSESVDIDNTNSGWSSSGSGSSTPDIEGDVYLCYADCSTAFAEQLNNDGFDFDLEGNLGIWFELTLSDDGEYLLTVDGETFGADLIDYFTDNKDTLMMGFLGVSSVDELYEYEESLGSDTYDVLESTTVQSFVSAYSVEYADLTDYGTYTIDGDTINFVSNDYEGFYGTFGDDMISINTGASSLNGGEPLDFYPEG